MEDQMPDFFKQVVEEMDLTEEEHQQLLKIEVLSLAEQANALAAESSLTPEYERHFLYGEASGARSEYLALVSSATERVREAWRKYLTYLVAWYENPAQSE
ncbi:hypothetical protein A2619_02640 [candidate division WWE3 bacterium RIFOXYD1_FULL_39_9]|uniref:Uncharacterized protein n=1 Tax=candidate division WWE3 bacterium RIFOXYD1_FULL_39_9 TaxID=1802649 RepID=A0A1F4X946_UNCKA|nr:MAG: hypothetical protein A2619_02640 [candidate division WWE3 bacterium RIFOXYD1_FULL_39_9]